MNFQYKNVSTWTDIPEYAHPDDLGSVLVVWPKVDSTDGQGAPCAVGLPNLEIKAKLMRGDGLNWWQAFFASTTAESATLTGITGFDPRTGTWTKYTGTLWRPVIGDVQPGAAAATTIYRDVLIQVRDLVTTT